MTARTYDELFEPAKPHLWVAYDNTHATLRWQILDANDNDRVYTRTADLDHAIAFMRSAAMHGDATIDEDSVEFQRMFRQTLHSVRVDAEEAWLAAQDASSHDRLATVYRIRPHEQLDESA